VEDAVGVELRALRWAIIAAQYKSLRQAAETLNIRQSTLSRGLRDLEHQLGAILFERTKGGARPTLAGEEFLDAARRIIKEAEAIAARVKMRSRGESGRLAIGVHASLSAGNLRATLIEHRRRFPEVHTHLVDGSSNDLISNLANSNIDVASVVGDHATGDHATWDGRSLSVWSERVEHERLLLPRQGPGPEFLELLVGKIGCSKSCRIRRHDVALDRLLTLVGAGWGILVALEGATGVNHSGVTFRDIAYARQCRAFGLTLPSLRDKDKMWRETLLGAIGLVEWHGLKSAILAHCLNAESPSTAGIRRHAKSSCG
jgi:DNA-binding transcriptional LysR family regulator